MYIRSASDAFDIFAVAEFFKSVAFKTTTVIGSNAPRRSVIRKIFLLKI